MLSKTLLPSCQLLLLHQKMCNTYSSSAEVLLVAVEGGPVANATSRWYTSPRPGQQSSHLHLLAAVSPACRCASTWAGPMWETACCLLRCHTRRQAGGYCRPTAATQLTLADTVLWLMHKAGE